MESIQQEGLKHLVQGKQHCIPAKLYQNYSFYWQLLWKIREVLSGAWYDDSSFWSYISWDLLHLIHFHTDCVSYVFLVDYISKTCQFPHYFFAIQKLQFSKLVKNRFGEASNHTKSTLLSNFCSCILNIYTSKLLGSSTVVVYKKRMILAHPVCTTDLSWIPVVTL